MLSIENIRKKCINDIRGITNIDSSKPNVFISNHSCLMDIFYVKGALNDDKLITALSSRLMYKNEKERKEIIYKLLNPMPIEVHAGKNYTNLCLEQLVNLLCNNISFNIFPEGAYIKDEKNIYRPRTGTSRILYNAKDRGINVNLIPTAIEIKGNINNLDSFQNLENQVNISFLEPIDYQSDYENYKKSKEKIYLHNPLIKAFENIAQETNKKYIDEYIEIYPRESIIWYNGEIKKTSEITDKQAFIDYQENLENYTKKIIKK